MFTIDTRTGALADTTTPPEFVADEVFMVLPPEARDWGLRNGIPEPPGTAIATGGDYRVRSPDPYTLYEISLVLPLESQQIRLLAAVPGDTVEGSLSCER
jgi:hypothetical protein